MKAKLIVVFLLLQLGAVAFAAQVQVSKSTFSKANGYFQIRVQTAQNTHTGESLIVWQKTTALGRDSKILYRILNAKGKPITPARELAKRSGVGTPTAAYNPVLDQYAIVYDETGVNGNDTPQVYGRLVNAKGKPLGKEIILSTDAVSSNSYNFSPQIIFNSNSGEFVMVWTRDQADTDENDGLVGLRLMQDLTPAGPVKFIRQGAPLDIGILPSGKKLLVIIRVLEGVNLEAKADYLLATLDPALTRVRNSDFKRINGEQVTRDKGWQADLTFLPDGSGVIFFIDQDTLKRRNIDARGRLSGSASEALNIPKNNTALTNSSVAFSSNAAGSTGLLAATERTTSQDGTRITSTWVQVLDSKGKPLGDPVQIHIPPDNDTIEHAVVQPLQGNPADPAHAFSLYAESTQVSVVGRPEIISILKFKISVSLP